MAFLPIDRVGGASYDSGVIRDVPMGEPRELGGGATMFVVDCPAHGGRTVLSVAAVTGIAQRDGVIDVTLRCWCGGTILHRTGRNARRRNDGTDLAV
ncbi:hypothetical protein [Actinomarinicola tropica]|uniref:Uncharacterized protein n=1 Tax=Actinomarinicola tropica TaxID=2789776 RepID=A0A5Q2RDW1_9ACTN|nr:hypothetical protein [Actinomarinicola tropica]QGG95069.1 hypothetical protein GH723_08090 [Actinomarinicola tropica]